MSNLFLINLKNHNANYNELCKLSKEITRFALNNNFAVFFNSYDYGNEIINEAQMKDFLLISDNFLSKNCEFLNTSYFANVSDIEKFKKEFFKKFDFLKKLVEKLFQYNINLIEIYITQDGAVNSIKDFTEQTSSAKTFLYDLLIEIINNKEEYAYGFPTIKYNISPN